MVVVHGAVFFAKGYYTQYNMRGLFNGSDMEFAMYANSSEVVVDTSGANLYNNTWHLITVTWTSGDYLRFYKDGTLIATSASTLGGYATTGADPLTIGAFNEYSQSLCYGHLKHFRLYNVQLTDAQVAQTYNYLITLP